MLLSSQNTYTEKLANTICKIKPARNMKKPTRAATGRVGHKESTCTSQPRVRNVLAVLVLPINVPADKSDERQQTSPWKQQRTHEERQRYDRHNVDEEHDQQHEEIGVVKELEIERHASPVQFG